MQILFTGPRAEMVWNGFRFRRGEITEIPDTVNARILHALEGFVFMPERDSVLPEKRGPGRPRKVA